MLIAIFSSFVSVLSLDGGGVLQVLADVFGRPGQAWPPYGDSLAANAATLVIVAVTFGALVWLAFRGDRATLAPEWAIAAMTVALLAAVPLQSVVVEVLVLSAAVWLLIDRPGLPESRWLPVGSGLLVTGCLVFVYLHAVDHPLVLDDEAPAARPGRHQALFTMRTMAPSSVRVTAVDGGEQLPMLEWVFPLAGDLILPDEKVVFGGYTRRPGCHLAPAEGTVTLTIRYRSGGGRGSEVVRVPNRRCA